MVAKAAMLKAAHRLALPPQPSLRRRDRPSLRAPRVLVVQRQLQHLLDIGQQLVLLDVVLQHRDAERVRGGRVVGECVGGWERG